MNQTLLIIMIKKTKKNWKEKIKKEQEKRVLVEEKQKR